MRELVGGIGTEVQCIAKDAVLLSTLNVARTFKVVV